MRAAHEPKSAQFPPDFRRRCSDCRSFTQRRTCLVPEAAGLIPAGAGFGIAWPGPAHGATCSAWSRSPARAIVAVLTAAGRGGWPDSQMHKWLREADEHPDAVLEVLRAGGPTP